MTDTSTKKENAGFLAGVPLTDRYSAVWEEIHKRVEVRQNTRIQFAVVAVGAAVASLSTATQSMRLTNWLTGLAVAMPFLTWTFVLWSFHNDLTIGLLSLFCESCETISDSNNQMGMPGFHRRDQKWMVVASQFGRLSDIADILLVTLTGFPAIWLWISSIFISENSILAFKSMMPLALIGFHLLAGWFIWGKQKKRKKIRSEWGFKKTESGWELKQEKESIPSNG
jgi:hypothetical protein